MPQMAPMQWFMMFFMFSTIYLFASNKMYFSPTPFSTQVTKPINFSKNMKMNLWLW